MFLCRICCQAAAAYRRGEKCQAAELSEKVVSLVNLLFTILKSTYSFQLLQIVHKFSTPAHQAVNDWNSNSFPISNTCIPC